ncbi:MAG: hypothetical protein ACOCPZ_00710 [Natrialbaceae archaeon]
MTGISIHISGPVAVLIAALGALWIYQDAKARRMDTADMWAVGFAVAFFIPPIIGGVAVLFYYFQKRNRRPGEPIRTPRQ